jgi:hypothetical protein
MRRLAMTSIVLDCDSHVLCIIPRPFVKRRGGGGYWNRRRPPRPRLINVLRSLTMGEIGSQHSRWPPFETLTFLKLTLLIENVAGGEFYIYAVRVNYLFKLDMNTQLLPYRVTMTTKCNMLIPS